ncbi:DNA-3-methyladenine glycosylase I [Lactobacillus sp. LC28-10]|uniref:DNA-3-methyladenine glycosylase I n=1 Tax=Secundilactobacillus angelensis TaxID=2722706 RepID=A0ABX1L0G2_9LACO|nr:DNA-3-methyladenine glycosylase I [Secundilactobacillus angelensis]MCH5463023.1 DNA-3-methyladenine glycosylase I [Secundilactobacillus angelensis]NLR19354.1 DNA-3-methyladenine glycosylase I [Secundilactobacillus angelensis]
MTRCDWAENANELMTHYHDYEWGVPTKDERETFELMTLEMMQAGLSWQTVLNKRENFREAFANFDIEKIAQFDEDDVARLLNNAGIIRNKLKIKDTIVNAKQLVSWHEAGKTMNAYLWSFVNGKPVVNRYQSMADVPAQTPLSQEVSKALKKAGFKFVGPTIVQSWLEALGILDDHLAKCMVNHMRK